MEFVVYVDLVCTEVGDRIRSEFFDADRGEFGFYRECSFKDPAKPFKDDSIYVNSYVRDIRIFEFDSAPVVPIVGKKYRLEFIYFTDMFGELNFHVGLPSCKPLD